MRKKLLRSRSGFEKPESREEAIMQNILGASNVLEPSESNIEEILKSILYNTPYTKEAEFEIEKILLAIKNNGTYDGEGESRDMKILIAILNDLNYTEEAESRIEELFIEWLLQRSSIKVLEGVPPLTFTSRGVPLINYLIEGNTVQNGTPSPQNPVDVNGTGERTENLFNTFDIVGQVPSISNGQLINYNGSTTSLIPIISGDITVTKPQTALLYLLLYAADMSYIGYVQNSTDANFYGSSVTGYENAKYCRLRIDRTTGLDDIQIMLNTGSTAKPFEPYGYKIPISSGGVTTNIYLGSTQTVRQVKKLVLTGNENYGMSLGNTWLILGSSAVDCRGTSDGAICSHLPLVARSAFSTNTCAWGAGEIGDLLLNIDNKDTLDLKSYIADQYANGTPVTLYYVLANPETGIVNEPLMKIGDYVDTLSKEQAGVQIPTNNGTTVIDVDTTVKPSNIYIEYK